MTIECEECGKDFKITPSRLKKNKHHTCSRQCSGKLASRLHSKKVKTSCTVCEADLYYKQSHFKEVAYPTCSKECAAISRSQRSRGKNNPRSLGLDDWQRIFWERTKNYQYRAKAKGIDCDLTFEYLIELYNKQQGKCYYSGYPLKTEKGISFDSMSLDRIESSKGYTKDNVVWCVNCLNMMKADHDLTDIKAVFREMFMKQERTFSCKVKLLYPDSKLCERAHSSDVGYDLYTHSVEDRGHYIIVGTGIAIQPERGYWNMIAPRSSIYKSGLTLANSVGIIDNEYSGELKMIFNVPSHKRYTLPEKGSRVGQLIPMPQYDIEFQQVDSLDDTDRGEGGFGSTS